MMSSSPFIVNTRPFYLHLHHRPTGWMEGYESMIQVLFVIERLTRVAITSQEDSGVSHHSTSFFHHLFYYNLDSYFSYGYLCYFLLLFPNYSYLM